MASRIRLIEHFDFIQDRETVTDKAIEFIESFGQSFSKANPTEVHPSLLKTEFTRNYNIDEYISPQEKKMVDKVTIDPRDLFESLRP